MVYFSSIQPTLGITSHSCTLAHTIALFSSIRDSISGQPSTMRIVSLIPSRGSQKHDDSMLENNDDANICTAGVLEKTKAASAFRQAPSQSRQDESDDEREPPSFDDRRRKDMNIFLPTTGPADHEKELGRCVNPPVSSMSGTSKRIYPKEKWAKTDREVSSNFVRGSFESMADYRKRCLQSK